MKVIVCHLVKCLYTYILFPLLIKTLHLVQQYCKRDYIINIYQGLKNTVAHSPEMS